MISSALLRSWERRRSSWACSRGINGVPMESVIQLDPYRASLDFDVMRKAEVAEAIAADAEIHGAGLTWMAPFVTLGIAASPAVRAGHNLRAEVAELADAHGSGPCTRKGVGVRVPSSAPETDLSHWFNRQMPK